MADKIQKLLKKLTSKERDIVKLLLLRLKHDDTEGLDIKRLRGHQDVYRLRKQRIRIIYRKTDRGFKLLRIDKRNEKTYKDL